ncbi:hypothetical protein LA080_011556 [Diaporthe eres]|nr:hypothetical protein LA080_011556 [Diaporthe eres]
MPDFHRKYRPGDVARKFVAVKSVDHDPEESRIQQEWGESELLPSPDVTQTVEEMYTAEQGPAELGARLDLQPHSRVRMDLSLDKVVEIETTDRSHAEAAMAALWWSPETWPEVSHSGSELRVSGRVLKVLDRDADVLRLTMDNPQNLWQAVTRDHKYEAPLWSSFLLSGMNLAHGDMLGGWVFQSPEAISQLEQKSFVISIVVTCCELAQKCVQIVNEVQAWPEELRRITRRISILEPLLQGLMSHLQSQAAPGLAGLQREQKNELENVMRETKECCIETHNILGECQSRKVGQTGFEFRESWLGDFSRSLYQQYGAMATALKKLEDNLEENYRDLNCSMGLLGIRQAWANHNALAAISERIRGLELEKAKLKKLNVHLAPPTTVPGGGQADDGSLGSYGSVSATVRQPTPEIRPTRTDYKILFTDTYGDRSMVSELLVKMLGAGTRSKGGDWRVEATLSRAFVERKLRLRERGRRAKPPAQVTISHSFRRRLASKSHRNDGAL